MDMSEHREVPQTSYSLHKAPHLGSERDVKQTAVPGKVYDTHVSGAFPINSGITNKTGAQQCANNVWPFCIFSSSGPLSVPSGEEIQMFLGWIRHCPVYPER